MSPKVSAILSTAPIQFETTHKLTMAGPDPAIQPPRVGAANKYGRDGAPCLRFIQPADAG